MKLFTKYSRINILATIIIFLIASAAFFFTIRYVLVHQIDQDLVIEEKEIMSAVTKHHHLPENMSVKDQLISYHPILGPSTKRSFGTVKLSDPRSKDFEKFRQLIFGIRVDDQWYEVSVSKSLEDTDDLIQSILLITISTILLMLVVSFIINRVVLKRIWKPFYTSLASVKDFKVSREQPLRLPFTQIEEFSFMNQTLERITSQAQHDYLSLKTFSENASHEIQTPIAIIRSKLDLLIQDENLTEQQSLTLQSAYNAIQKLTKLNQSLLLLAKIENNQYQETKPIDMKEKLREKIMAFQELWQSQQVTIKDSLNTAIVNMNEELADILLNNLLSNATKHNFEGGSISIELDRKQLTVKNTSEYPVLDNSQMFQRFYKNSKNNQHNGLGLSIIKQICDASGFSLRYLCQKNEHVFMISW
jgi:signal transduction histidine kinase